VAAVDVEGECEYIRSPFDLALLGLGGNLAHSEALRKDSAGGLVQITCLKIRVWYYLNRTLA